MTPSIWKFIEDLPPVWEQLVSSELHSLSLIWTEQSERLKDSSALKIFNERLGREWAIETGILENLYSLDRGITELLIERGIEASLIPHGTSDKPAEYVVQIVTDQKAALEGLFDFVSQRRPLSNSYVKELHQVFTRSQESVSAVDSLGKRIQIPLLRGDWKKLQNNPVRPDGVVYEYCPPEHVQAEMDRLMELHGRHVQLGVAPEVEAAWLHHRFTQIHPFQDGNGRIARALASLVFLRAGLFPLVIRRDDREEYIPALEAADHGDLGSLADLFVKVQRRQFLMALGIAEDVLRAGEQIEHVIKAASERLRERQKDIRSRAFETCKLLQDVCQGRLEGVAVELQREFSGLGLKYSVHTDQSNMYNDHWFKQQIVETAKGLKYFADTATYRAWVRLKIKEERQVEIVISFHTTGKPFSGVMVVSAFLEYRDAGEENEILLEGPYSLSKDVFQFSHAEPDSKVQDRFRRWQDEVIVFGLDQWRRQL
jgi:Fic family protein